MTNPKNTGLGVIQSNSAAQEILKIIVLDIYLTINCSCQIVQLPRKSAANQKVWELIPLCVTYFIICVAL